MPAGDLRATPSARLPLKSSLLGLFALAALSVGLAQCSTSGGSGSTVPKGTSSATPTPSPTPTGSTLPASATVMIPVGPSPGSGSLGPVLGGYSSSITFPTTGTAGTVTVTLSATQPGGTPTVQSMRRRPQTIGGVGLVPLAFITLTSPTSLTFTSSPSFSFSVPAAAVNAGQIPYLAYYDPTASPQTGWNTFDGPGTVSGTDRDLPRAERVQRNRLNRGGHLRHRAVHGDHSAVHTDVVAECDSLPDPDALAVSVAYQHADPDTDTEPEPDRGLEHLRIRSESGR